MIKKYGINPEIDFDMKEETSNDHIEINSIDDRSGHYIEVNENYKQTKVFNIRLINAISRTEYYGELFTALLQAKQNDEVNIKINSPGGYVSTGTEIIHAMERCPATITTSIEGEACSMAALIFLCGDKKEVGKFSQLMLHSASSGYYGKQHEMKDYSTHLDEHFSTMLQKICYPFMSKQEIKSMIKGKDFWFSADEIQSRLDK